MKRVFFVLAAVCALGKPGWGGPVPASHSLSQDVSDSGIIVVCKIASFAEGKNAAVPEPNSYVIVGGKKHWSYSGAPMYQLFNRIQEPGRYTFSDAQTIRGTLNAGGLTLPAIVSPYLGGLRTPPRPGDEVLLLLGRDKTTGALTPTDPLIPLIPLSRRPFGAQLTSKTNSLTKDPLKAVEEVLMASMADSTYRQATSYLLHSETGPSIVEGLAKYVNDPNLEVRANVLYAMLINQQVSCIPRVAILEHVLEDRGNGTQSNALGALDSLTTPESVDCLNPLLWDSYFMVRSKAMERIGDLGNSSSVPFLLLSTQDPDPSLGMKHSAVAMLEHLCPGLHLTAEVEESQGNVQGLKQSYAWWSDELNGKHSPRLWANPDDVLPAGPNALDKLVWAGDSAHRERALTALEAVANKDSVPYLLVALYDPDPVVAYKSYVVLNGLLGNSDKPVGPEAFAKSPDEYTGPLFGWWRAELLGHHRLAPLNGATYVTIPPAILSAISAQIKAKDSSSP